MPIQPIIMQPCYRHGAMTPWGGKQLKTIYKRDIPSDVTGESLEISAIPSLNSKDENGVGLEALIAKYGAALTGEGFEKPFPLLLKIISAEDKLSVQVHPDDSYAKQHENKLGKTEAWIILDAKEGAELIFGIKEGVSKEMLKDASCNGKQVETLLKRVKVHKGDAFFIPAGTVHAICEGIVLYEIQQSSDVTYRFYDWDRADKNGNKRELHLQKALDVTNLSASSSKAEKRLLEDNESGKRYEIFSCPFFKTEELSDADRFLLANDKKRFRMLTSLEGGSLEFADTRISLAPLQSVLLPADGYDIQISGKAFYLSYPM